MLPQITELMIVVIPAKAGIQQARGAFLETTRGRRAGQAIKQDIQKRHYAVVAL